MRLFFIVLAVWLFAIPSQALVRIKDITAPQGMRDNQLVGYGLIVGLQGSGDTLRNSVFTEQTLQSMLDRMGVNVRGMVLRTRNVAAVIVTADLPPSIGRGSRVDITVSSLGDATSLMGGTLIMTPLNGADGQTYAVAQGAVIVSGMAAVGQAEIVTQGVPTAARIPNGATIEREPPGRLADLSPLSLELKNPDYSTVVRITDAINEYSLQRFGKRTAKERDFRTVVLSRPPRIGTARFLAEIGDLVVEPDTVARIVVDARTGTIVIGQDVQISTVAVTHGNLSVRITEAPVVSQPAPLSRGQTVVTPQTAIDVSESGGQIALVGGSTLRTLVRGLNQIGVKPSGVIAILQAIKTSGALQADLVVQ